MSRRKVTMPSTPNFVESNFQLVRVVGSGQSVFTGKDYTQDFGGSYWTFAGSLPPLNRSQASEWQSFLLECGAGQNVFEFADPDALTNQGSFNEAQLKTEKRINQTSVTLSAARSTSRITSSTAIFGSLVNGDYVHITGFLNNENNGTFKITNKASTTIIEVSAYLTDESNKAGCQVRQNVQGSGALSLEASSNSGAGTIKKGDYLGIRASDITNTNLVKDPVQYVMVTEDATETNNGGSAKNHYSVKISPELRSDLADANIIQFTNPKGLFRIATPVAEWSADNVSLYGIQLTCFEVI